MTVSAGEPAVLKRAVAASYVDVINITKDIRLDAALDVAHSVTINGGGHTLSRNANLDDDKEFSLIKISGAGRIVRIDNLIIMGGRAGSGGGMAVGDKATATVTNCTFKDNTATGRGYEDGGGGMFVWAGGTATVTNCTFTGNAANCYDGGGGGMKVRDGGTVKVTGCTFTGNTASYGSGGGGISVWNGGTATVTNCTFTGNTAPTGGGVAVERSTSATVISCTFTGNTANSGAGLEVRNGGMTTVTNCTFTGNTANDFYGNGGGGIYVDTGGKANVTDCTFTGNTSESCDSGGGMFVNKDGTANVTNCTFTGNTSDGCYGGGGMFVDTDGTANVTNCTLVNNVLTMDNSQGSEVYCKGTLDAVNTIFWNSDSENVNHICASGTIRLYSCAYDASKAEAKTENGGTIAADGNGNVKDLSWAGGVSGHEVRRVTVDGVEHTVFKLKPTDKDSLIDNGLTAADAVARLTSLSEDDRKAIKKALDTDQIGAPRTGNPDIGAIEYTEASITTTSH